MQEIKVSLKPLVCSDDIELYLLRRAPHNAIEVAKLRPIEFKLHDPTKKPLEEDALTIPIPDILCLYKSLGEELERYGLVKPPESIAVNIELRKQIASLEKIVNGLTQALPSLQPVVNTFIDREKVV